MRKLNYILYGILLLAMHACSPKSRVMEDNDHMARLILIEPQHFHAALVQKYVSPDIDSNVYLYADLAERTTGYRQLIDQYNGREKDATNWLIHPYFGPDFLQKAFHKDQGNVVILAGDNNKKIEYIGESVRHGKDVFADKPLVIDTEGYNKLKGLFSDNKELVVYDIMTERYDVKNQLIKNLINNTDFSGGMRVGGTDASIQFASTHHFIKEVSGNHLIRPAMFYNTAQQGEGLVDVTTHYIDLVQWILSSDKVIDIEKDIKLKSSSRWKTTLTEEEFYRSTGLQDYPSSLLPAVQKDHSLAVFSNGKLDYDFKGIPISIAVKWNVESLDGKGDQFRASFSTQKFTIEVKPDTKGKMSVFVLPIDDLDFEIGLKDMLTSIKDLPGLTAEKVNNAYKINIPDQLYLSHEDHFTKVLGQFLIYRKEKQLPAWEKSFMLAKYYLTTQALEKATTVTYEKF